MPNLHVNNSQFFRNICEKESWCAGKNGGFPPPRISRSFLGLQFPPVYGPEGHVLKFKKSHQHIEKKRAGLKTPSMLWNLSYFVYGSQSQQNPGCLVSCKKSRALCHCSPVRNLVGLAGFAMNFPQEMDGFCCCILPLWKGMKMVVYSVLFFKMIVLTNQTLMLFSIRCFFKIILSANQTLMVIICNYTLITLTQSFQSIQFKHSSTYFHDKTKHNLYTP